ncbi:MAG TPA: hypothetical protein VF155_07760 [Candidatus Dormibacteraeota bacterium]
MDLVPSYILKAGRAEHHLHDLKLAITKWADSHPYEVRPAHHRKINAYRLRFTANPPPPISLIAADFVYNLRSGLDHLMTALVPATERSKVYFPIYFQGVWEDADPGEHEKRTKERGRWKSDTAKVRPEAVAILKSLQPPDVAWKAGHTLHVFRALNLISNKDRHQKLPLVFTALRSVRMLWVDTQGTRHIEPGDTGDVSVDQAVCQDGAEFHLPKGAMDVQVVGGPVVAIDFGPEQGNAPIPEVFDLALSAYRETVNKLVPYIHRGRRRHGVAPSSGTA